MLCDLAIGGAGAIQWGRLLFLMGISAAVGLGIYYSAGLFFELAYYRRRRADAASWKCQPGRFPAPRLRRSELALGTLNMTTTSLVSGVFVYGVEARGWSRIYFHVADHGWAWTLCSTVLYFVTVDLLLYLAHRAYHRRTLFRLVHRWHHRYVAPTAFTASAAHPVEIHSYHLLTLAPLFVFPVHAASVVAVLLYTNYLALLDHSGVKLWSVWPWQAPTRFHDDHHVHFHVNYGQNMSLWDRLFGTYRRQGRRYGVEVYGGRGESLAGPDRHGGREPLFDYSREADAAALAAAHAGEGSRTAGRSSVGG